MFADALLLVGVAGRVVGALWGLVKVIGVVRSLWELLKVIEVAGGVAYQLW